MKTGIILRTFIQSSANILIILSSECRVPQNIFSLWSRFRDCVHCTKPRLSTFHINQNICSTKLCVIKMASQILDHQHEPGGESQQLTKKITGQKRCVNVVFSIPLCMHHKYSDRNQEDRVNVFESYRQCISVSSMQKQCKNWTHWNIYPVQVCLHTYSNSQIHQDKEINLLSLE